MKLQRYKRKFQESKELNNRTNTKINVLFYNDFDGISKGRVAVVYNLPISVKDVMKNFKQDTKILFSQKNSITKGQLFDIELQDNSLSIDSAKSNYVYDNIFTSFDSDKQVIVSVLFTKKFKYSVENIENEKMVYKDTPPYIGVFVIDV